MKITLDYYCLVDEYGRVATMEKKDGHGICPVSKLDSNDKYKIALFNSKAVKRMKTYYDSCFKINCEIKPVKVTYEIAEDK